jgi:hypothetical protein
MEALPWPAEGSQGPIRAIPDVARRRSTPARPRRQRRDLHLIKRGIPRKLPFRRVSEECGGAVHGHNRNKAPSIYGMEGALRGLPHQACQLPGSPGSDGRPPGPNTRVSSQFPGVLPRSLSRLRVVPVSSGRCISTPQPRAAQESGGIKSRVLYYPQNTGGYPHFNAVIHHPIHTLSTARRSPLVASPKPPSGYPARVVTMIVGRRDRI